MQELIKNKTIQNFVIKWLIYWLIVMGGFILVLKPNGITHLENIHLGISYYLIAAFLGLKLFYKKEFNQYIYSFRAQSIIYIITAILFVIITVYLGEAITLPESHREYMMEKKFYYPLMYWKSTISKLSDLIFQQFLIICLVLFLKQQTQSNKKTVELFTWIFFILHFPLFFVFGFSGIVFILPSLLAGILFSYSIVGLKWGIYASMCVHQIYYIALAILMRIVPFEWLL